MKTFDDLAKNFEMMMTFLVLVVIMMMMAMIMVMAKAMMIIKLSDELGGDVMPLALSPTPLHIRLTEEVKEPTSLFKKCRGHKPWCCGLAFPS